MLGGGMANGIGDSGGLGDELGCVLIGDDICDEDGWVELFIGEGVCFEGLERTQLSRLRGDLGDNGDDLDELPATQSALADLRNDDIMVTS